ncbi:MAG: tetratricopeptide repeat protein [Spirochaetaceae bacterium]|nr:tetratricopeptide repeat protein [Spirochaetaceae bacterium]
MTAYRTLFMYLAKALSAPLFAAALVSCATTTYSGGDARSMTVPITRNAYYGKPQASPQKTVDAYMEQGIMFASRDEFEPAIRNFTEALKLDPNYAGAYCNRGVAYAATGDYPRAIADLNQAIKLDPNYTNVYYYRGVSYAAAGAYDYAIADFNYAAKLDPSNAEIYNGRGITYIRKGDYDSARADFKRILQINPNDEFALFLLAQLDGQ